MNPNHWYEHDCEFCYQRTKMYFDDERPDPIYCPHCGTSVEQVDELDFNDYD